MDGEDPNSLLLPEIHVDLPPPAATSTSSSTSNSLDWDDLRRRSLRPGGFGKERATLWPQLLCVPPQLSTETEMVTEAEEHELEPHPDERQIKLDTDRSFVLYPVDESMTDRVQRQQELNALLTNIFRRHPGLSYFQGYHDIITVLLLTLPPSLRLPAAEKLSLHRLRDSMGKTLEPLVGLLRILQRLLRLADPAYAALLEQSSPLPYPLLSPLLTLFSHDIPSLPHIQHIFDYLLCRPPIAVVYLCAALVLEGESGRRGRVEGVFGVRRTSTCQRAREESGRAGGVGGEEEGEGEREGEGEGEEEEQERDIGMVFSLLAGVPEMWDGEDEEDEDMTAEEDVEGMEGEEVEGREGEDVEVEGEDEDDEEEEEEGAEGEGKDEDGPEEIIPIPLDVETVSDDQQHLTSKHEHARSSLSPSPIPTPHMDTDMDMDNTLVNPDSDADADATLPETDGDGGTETEHMDMDETLLNDESRTQSEGETETEGEITLVGTSPSPFREDLVDVDMKVKPAPPLRAEPVIMDVKPVGVEGEPESESKPPVLPGAKVEVKEGEKAAGLSEVEKVVEVEDPDRKDHEEAEGEEQEQEVDPASIPLPHSRAPSSSCSRSRSRSRSSPAVTTPTKSPPRSRSFSSKPTPNPTTPPPPKPHTKSNPKSTPKSKPKPTPTRQPQSQTNSKTQPKPQSQPNPKSKKPRPPLTLTSLLTQSDALMARYPPEHPALHLEQTMGPKSVVRTWAEHRLSPYSAGGNGADCAGGQVVTSDGHVLSDAECEEIVRNGKIEDVVLPWDPSMDEPEPEQPSSGRDGDSDSESEGVDEGEEHERSWFGLGGLGALVRRPHLRHRHGRRPSTSTSKGESESEKENKKTTGRKAKPKRPRRKLRKQHRPFFGAPRGVEFDRRTMIAGAALVLGVAMAVYASRGGGVGGGYGRGRMGGVGGLVGVLGEMFGGMGEVGGGRGFGM